MNLPAPKNIPRLPRLLAAPLARLPDPLHSRLLALALTRTLNESLREGELDFLQDKSLSIRVRDAGIQFHLTLGNGRLVAASPAGQSDLVIEGSVYDFMQLLGRQVDPDTLVFQRRLVMQGNTELGLEVKNFLDGLDMEALALHRYLEPVLLKILPVYKKLFS